LSKKIINEFGSNGAQKQPISQSAQPQKQQNQAQKTHNLFVRFCLNLADFSMRLF
jgi:hypothetical protein